MESWCPALKIMSSGIVIFDSGVVVMTVVVTNMMLSMLDDSWMLGIIWDVCISIIHKREVFEVNAHRSCYILVYCRFTESMSCGVIKTAIAALSLNEDFSLRFHFHKPHDSQFSHQIYGFSLFARFNSLSRFYAFEDLIIPRFWFVQLFML